MTERSQFRYFKTSPEIIRAMMMRHNSIKKQYLSKISVGWGLH